LGMAALLMAPILVGLPSVPPGAGGLSHFGREDKASIQDGDMVVSPRQTDERKDQD
jgi:hypothetical protein